MTTYRVTANRPDMHRAQSLLRAQGQKRVQWHYPVVLAEQGPELLGALGTQIISEQVVCGPLVLRRDLGRRAPLVAYRLGRLYEDALRKAGVRFYILYVPPRLTQWAYVLERLGYEPVPPEHPGGGQWFRRWIGPWGQVHPSRHEAPMDGFAQAQGGIR
jgi:hypothetical protein